MGRRLPTEGRAEGLEKAIRMKLFYNQEAGYPRESAGANCMQQMGMKTPPTDLQVSLAALLLPWAWAWAHDRWMRPKCFNKGQWLGSHCQPN
jgi:hypothetical protein